MGDEKNIKERLQTSADHCLKTYEAWESNKKDGAARAALQDAVHELRKVSSRLEIELAVSDRDEGSRKQIPIPPHRDARKRTNDDDSAYSDDGGGNTHHDGGPNKGGKSGGGNRGGGPRKRTPRKASGGGSGE